MKYIRKPRPLPPIKPCMPRCNILADGATAIFPFYLNGRTFRYEDIAQITYLFNYGNSSIDYYELFDAATGQIDTGSVEAGYTFNYNEQTNSVSLSFSPTHVSDMPTETVIEFEIVVKLKDGTTILDRQAPLMIKPSIYGELLDSTKRFGTDTPICSQSTLCSTRLACNE